MKGLVVPGLVPMTLPPPADGVSAPVPEGLALAARVTVVRHTVWLARAAGRDRRTGSAFAQAAWEAVLVAEVALWDPGAACPVPPAANAPAPAGRRRFRVRARIPVDAGDIQTLPDGDRDDVTVPGVPAALLSRLVARTTVAVREAVASLPLGRPHRRLVRDAARDVVYLRAPGAPIASTDATPAGARRAASAQGKPPALDAPYRLFDGRSSPPRLLGRARVRSMPVPADATGLGAYALDLDDDDALRDALPGGRRESLDDIFASPVAEAGITLGARAGLAFVDLAPFATGLGRTLPRRRLALALEAEVGFSLASLTHVSELWAGLTFRFASTPEAQFKALELSVVKTWTFGRVALSLGGFAGGFQAQIADLGFVTVFGPARTRPARFGADTGVIVVGRWRVAPAVAVSLRAEYRWTFAESDWSAGAVSEPLPGLTVDFSGVTLALGIGLRL